MCIRDSDTIDYLLEGFAALGVILLIAFPLFYFNQLPDMVPTHFDMSGNPDRFDKKSSLFIVPVIGTLLYLFLHFLSRNPHTFNYGVKITAENAAYQYRIGVRLTRMINALTMVLLASLNFFSIQIALKKMESIPSFLSWGFLFLIMGTVIYFLFKSLKNG